MKSIETLDIPDQGQYWSELVAVHVWTSNLIVFIICFTTEKIIAVIYATKIFAKRKTDDGNIFVNETVLKHRLKENWARPLRCVFERDNNIGPVSEKGHQWIVSTET